MIGFSPRRSLTFHQDWKEVLETLRARLHTVKLPKPFVAIDLREKADAFERKNGNDSKGKEHNISELEERGRSEEKERRVSLISIADANGEIISPSEIVPPELRKDISPTVLPPPVSDVEH